MRNEPNFGRGGRRDRPLFQYSIIPAFQSPADSAKQSQSRAGGRGTRVRYKQSQLGSRPLGAKNAKQTQFGQTGRQAGSPESKNVQNEPNFGERTGRSRGPVVQTDPIPGAVPIRRSAFPGANHAKQSQTWAGWDIWGAAIRERPILQNKANSSTADCGFGIADSARPGARRQGLRGRLYKQTQFCGLGHRRIRTGRGHGLHGTKRLSPEGGSDILRAQASGVRPRSLAWGSPLGAAECEKMPKWQNRTRVQRI
jgi:hypothetical protein